MLVDKGIVSLGTIRTVSSDESAPSLGRGVLVRDGLAMGGSEGERVNTSRLARSAISFLLLAMLSLVAVD